MLLPQTSRLNNLKMIARSLAMTVDIVYLLVALIVGMVVGSNPAAIKDNKN